MVVQRGHEWAWAELIAETPVAATGVHADSTVADPLSELRDLVGLSLSERLSADAAFALWAVPALLDPLIASQPWPGLAAPEQCFEAALVLDPSLRRATRQSTPAIFKGVWLLPVGCRGARLSMVAIVAPGALATAAPWMRREVAAQALARQGAHLHLRLLDEDAPAPWPEHLHFAIPLSGAYPRAWQGHAAQGPEGARTPGPASDWPAELAVTPPMALPRVLARAMAGLARERGLLLDVVTRREILGEARAPELWCQRDAIALSGLWSLLRQDPILAESATRALALCHDDASWPGLQRMLGLPPCHGLPSQPLAAARIAQEVILELALLLDEQPAGQAQAHALRGWLAQFEERPGWIPRSPVRELRSPGRLQGLVLQEDRRGGLELRADSPAGFVLASGDSLELTLGRLASHGLLRGSERVRVLPPLEPRRAVRALGAIDRFLRSRDRALILIETSESAGEWSAQASPPQRIVLIIREGQGARVEALAERRDLEWLTRLPLACAGAVQIVPVAGSRAWILGRYAGEALAALGQGHDVLVDVGDRPLLLTQRGWRALSGARVLASALARPLAASRIAAVGSGALAATLRQARAHGVHRAPAHPILHVVEDHACLACVDEAQAIRLWPSSPGELSEHVEDIHRFAQASGRSLRVIWHSGEASVRLRPPLPANLAVSLEYRQRRPWRARVGELVVELDRQALERLAQAILACTRPFNPPLFRIESIELAQAGLVHLLRLRHLLTCRLEARLSRLAERTRISPQAPVAVRR